ncbi:MAG: helix-turn-helix domain-containing protein [Bryobacterales bacterium]|nr:helix-turn-helix domain-containing protein [Bryobacterales bacterium]
MILTCLRRRLLEDLLRRIHGGEFTERGLAHRLGVSQPHIHNILKGTRTMSLELADHIIADLEIPAERLLSVEDLRRIHQRESCGEMSD